MINVEEEYLIKELYESFKSENDKYKLEFLYVEPIIDPQYEIASTMSCSLNCVVRVTDKLSGEVATAPIYLLELLLKGSMGAKIDGTNYEYCALNDRASGWYNVRTNDSDGQKLPSLELRPARGRSLYMVYKKGYFNVIFKSSKGGKRVLNLAVFLKAFTGLTYREILSYIGIRNRVISRTFINEKSYEECVNIVLDALLPSSGNTKPHESIPPKFRVSELKKLLGPTYITLDQLARDRYNRDSSFSYRALGLDLAVPVLNYPVGTKLTQEILEEIDATDLDTLFVNKGREMFELKKYKVSQIDLCSHEIFTEVNMLVNNACGFDLYAKTSDDIDRVVISLRDSVRKEIAGRLISIVEHIHSYLMNENMKLTDLDIANIPIEDPYSFIKKCKQEFKNMQGSETTNIVAHLSKDQKVVMNYSGKTNAEMIAVKGSQQSMYDHYNIPENDKIGLVSHLTISSVIGKDGMVYSPYIKIENGKPVSDEPVYLNPRQREGKYIAPWDADLSQPKVRCYYKDDFPSVKKSKIDYMEYTVLQTISVATSMVEVPQFMEGKRTLMACNGYKQALVCLSSEAPRVATGSICLLPNQRNIVIRANDILDSIYTVNNLLGVVDYEEFMKGAVSLVNLDSASLGYRSYMFQTEFNGQIYGYKEVLPFHRRGTESSMFHYFLKYQVGHVYRGRDIIFYNNGVDVNKYNLDLNINLGTQKVDLDAFDYDQATGCNFFIAFKSSGLGNMDDGIVISDALLGTGKLAHAKLILVTYELKNFKEGIKERFGVLKETSVFNENGLPKVGSWLKPKSNVIGFISTKSAGYSKDRVSTETQMFHALGADVEGEVLGASIDGDVASVLIGSISEIELGDKLAGSHGNKGVIGKIVPAKDMPYREDGSIIEMTLNPLGIPSRMNISQSISSLLGFAAKMADKRYVISSYNPDTFDIIDDLLKEQPNLGREILYDGRTGRPFERPVAIGVLYMKKLQHVVTGKMNNCGVATNYNPISGQPNKGKDVSGGQTFGEMETWALEALGLHHFINETFSIKSDDFKNRKNFLQCLELGIPYTGKMVNSNIDFIQTNLRVMGCELELKGSDYFIRPMIDDDIRGLSVSAQKNQKDSLQDDELYGPCKRPAEIQEGKKRYSYLELNCEIVHPIWIYKSSVPSLVIYLEQYLKKDRLGNEQIATKKTFLGKQKIKDIIDGKYYLSVDIENKVVKGSSNPDLLENPLCGITAFVEALKATDLEKSIKFYRGLVNKIKSDEGWEDSDTKRERVFALLNKIATAETFKSQGLELKDLILTTFPVIPKPFRYSIDGRGSSFDKYYSRIISAIKDPNVVDPTTVYMKVLEFIGLDTSVKLSKDSNMKNWLEYATGKGTDNKSKGYGRLHALSHVSMFSGRSVIIPGEVPMGYVGLPRQACYNIKKIELRKIYRDELTVNGYKILDNQDINVDTLISHLELGDFIKASEFFKSLKMDNHLMGEITDEVAEDLVNQCDNIIRRLLSESAVLIGRQPTLHDESVQGCIPIMVEGNALHIHTILCSGFNADFDGDQMWYAFAVTYAAKQEVLTKAHPMNKLRSSKDGSISLNPTQDILLGLYLMTMLHENELDVAKSDKYSLENTHFYSSIDSLIYDVNAGYVNRKDLVCLEKDGNRYLSTAGRIILNNVTPNGFTDKPFTNPLNIEGINVNNYKSLMVDALIRKSTTTLDYVRGDRALTYQCVGVNDFISKASEGMTNEEIMRLIDRIVECGIESCVVSGITLHYNDFKDFTLSEKLIEKYNAFIEKRDRLFDLGLLTEESKKQLALKATNFITKAIKDRVMDLYSRNDNLFIVMDSGARGNVSQVVRTTGILGTISRSNVEQIETPILRNFKNGLSSLDSTIMANGTHHGVSAVQQDVGKVGEMTRALVFGLDGMKVNETDCGCGFRTINIEYGECKTRTADLLDRKLLNTSELYFDTTLITKEGLINFNVIDYITKHHIKEVPLDDGTVFKLEYKITDFFKGLLINKLAEDLPYLENGQVITKETLMYIEEQQLESIKARTILTCHTTDGVCAKCYGVLFNGRKLASVGYAAGIKAAQSMGEPATQLYLDTINAAGSGNSTANAVVLFKGLASGSIPAAFTKAVISKSDCFVELQESGDSYIIKVEDNAYKAKKSDVKVVNGEKVFGGQELVSGVYDVNDIPEKGDYLLARLLKLTSIYYSIFKGSNIEIDVRHFEILARAQQSYVFITKSNDPNVPEGSIQNVGDVLKSREEGFVVEGFNRTLKKTEQIFKVSGSLSAICHHDPAKAIALTSTNRTFKNGKNSLIGSIISGTDLVTGTKGVPTKPAYRDLVLKNKEVNTEEVAVESLADMSVFSIVENNNSNEIALDSIDDLDFGFLDDSTPAPTTVVEEPSLDGFDFPDETPKAENIKTSNVFGGASSLSVDDLGFDDLFNSMDKGETPNDKSTPNVNSLFNDSPADSLQDSLQDSLEEQIDESGIEEFLMDLDEDVALSKEEEIDLDDALDLFDESTFDVNGDDTVTIDLD